MLCELEILKKICQQTKSYNVNVHALHGFHAAIKSQVIMYFGIRHIRNFKVSFFQKIIYHVYIGRISQFYI